MSLKSDMTAQTTDILEDIGFISSLFPHVKEAWIQFDTSDFMHFFPAVMFYRSNLWLLRGKKSGTGSLEPCRVNPSWNNVDSFWRFGDQRSETILNVYVASASPWVSRPFPGCFQADSLVPPASCGGSRSGCFGKNANNSGCQISFFWQKEERWLLGVVAHVGINLG